jgi:hypothetical protein
MLVFWPISYWFPLPEYLGVLASEEYANYQLALRSIVIIYLIFFILNLVTAGLAATKLSGSIKFWLALVPAAVLLFAPLALVIPTALRFPDQNYFVIFEAMYRLLRFTSPVLLALALLSTVLAVALNVRAALMFRNSNDLGSISPILKKRYFIYGGIAFLALAIIVPLGAYNASVRSLDRAACNRYANLEIPELDEDVPVFLSEIRVIGESAGSRGMQNTFINFSDLSRQYFALINSEPAGSALLADAEKVTASARNQVIETCSEFAVK